MDDPRGDMPPAYSQAHEMQDPGEYMYPGDTNILIGQDPRVGKNEPAPPYTHNWPPEGGYVSNPMSQAHPQHLQRQVVVVRQADSNGLSTYIRWRVGICVAFVVVKVIIIGIVFGAIYGSRY